MGLPLVPKSWPLPGEGAHGEVARGLGPATSWPPPVFAPASLPRRPAERWHSSPCSEASSGSSFQTRREKQSPEEAVLCWGLCSQAFDLPGFGWTPAEGPQSGGCCNPCPSGPRWASLFRTWHLKVHECRLVTRTCYSIWGQRTLPLETQWREMSGRPGPLCGRNER